MYTEFNSLGYESVKILCDGKRKHFKIHRLVAMAFLPNPQNLPEVNHKDENPSNNCVDNLEWCSHRYNMNYGTVKERISKNNMGKSCRNGYEKPVIQYDLDGNFIALHKNIIQAAKSTNIARSTIKLMLNGKTKKQRKYVFKYKE